MEHSVLLLLLKAKILALLLSTPELPEKALLDEPKLSSCLVNKHASLFAEFANKSSCCFSMILDSIQIPSAVLMIGIRSIEFVRL